MSLTDSTSAFSNSLPLSSTRSTHFENSLRIPNTPRRSERSPSPSRRHEEISYPKTIPTEHVGKRPAPKSKSTDIPDEAADDVTGTSSDEETVCDLPDSGSSKSPRKDAQTNDLMQRVRVV